MSLVPVLSRQDRMIRGWIIALCANILGAGSHALGGGQLPHPILWLLSLALSALLCVGFSGRRMSTTGIALSVLASQTVFHTLFSLSGAVAHIHPAQLHHGHLAAVSTPGNPYVTPATGTAFPAETLTHTSHGALTLPMFAGHLSAAVITFAVIWRGEAATRRILNLLRTELNYLARLFQLPPLRYDLALLPAVRTESLPHRLLNRRTLTVRGPPISMLPC